ncbi:hypothetical protein N7456_011975 [Penicillium angulare]|uniref:Major facilitator superfamily (MFS) profile domain-containing protein n=1 Tax=Penicillium angulare TaxID=116970 RepID=A0A9W9EUV9_9EURO|nr:hypothetical protein N7456_011975 [Penicillium angulare]
MNSSNITSKEGSQVQTIGKLEKVKVDSHDTSQADEIPQAPQAIPAHTTPRSAWVSNNYTPSTATTYFPLLPLLRTQFHTSSQAINLTLTIYIIFQAISPVIFGPLSDFYGRRPTFILSLALYVVGNLGLAINKDNYAVLLVLRATQSFGASAAYAISFGVVADVCTSNERGRMLGPINMTLNLGACVGPIIGGVVAYTSDSYIWVFWALVIVGVILFCSVGLFLPETSRNVVGDGGDLSRYKWWQYSGIGLARQYFADSGQKAKCDYSRPSEKAKTRSSGFDIAKLLSSFRIIFYRDTFLALWIHGSFYTVDYSLVAAMPDIYKDVYHYNNLQLGLAYLPRGVGIIIGSYCTGKFMDASYQAVASAAGLSTDRVRGNDLLKFPIERARSRGSFIVLCVSTATMIGYGWAVQRGAPVAIPLILQFIQGAWGTYFYTTFSTLLVDGFPRSSSTAAATTSITRCAMAATGVAILQTLLDAAGKGWYFTTLGLWSGGFGAVAVLLLRWKGMEWRRVRSGLSACGDSPPDPQA